MAPLPSTTTIISLAGRFRLRQTATIQFAPPPFLLRASHSACGEVYGSVFEHMFDNDVHGRSATGLSVEAPAGRNRGNASVPSVALGGRGCLPVRSVAGSIAPIRDQFRFVGPRRRGCCPGRVPCTFPAFEAGALPQKPSRLGVPGRPQSGTEATQPGTAIICRTKMRVGLFAIRSGSAALTSSKPLL